MQTGCPIKRDLLKLALYFPIQHTSLQANLRWLSTLKAYNNAKALAQCERVYRQLVYPWPVLDFSGVEILVGVFMRVCKYLVPQKSFAYYVIMYLIIGKNHEILL